jgi:L-rhamnose mutarotase
LGWVALLVARLVLAAPGWAQPRKPSGKSGPARYGMVIEIKPDRIDYYKKLHAQPWPSVTKKLTEVNIRNFSIFLKELEPGRWYLFGYYEYVGRDLDADWKKMLADPETKRWLKETDPCQTPIPTRKAGEWWAMMEPIFYLR